MPTPKYTKVAVFDKESGQWVTELHVVIDGVSGVLIKVLIDPNVNPVFKYQEAVLDEEGKVTMVEREKNDWKEEQTFFVPDGENEDVILSKACWNHMNQLEKLFAPVPEAPVEGETKDAIAEDQLT